MTSNNMLNKIKKVYNKYSITSFILVLFISLFISRWLGIHSGIHPSLSHFRLHHFYYGLLLLIISKILLIFRDIDKRAASILTAISLGMIFDELILVFTLDQAQYTWSSFPQAILITFIFSLLVVLISKFKK